MKKIQLFLLQFLLISITQHTNAQLPVKTEYIVEMGGTSGKGTYAPMCGLLPTGKVYLLPIPKMVIYGQGLHIQCH